MSKGKSSVLARAETRRTVKNFWLLLEELAREYKRTNKKKSARKEKQRQADLAALISGVVSKVTSSAEKPPAPVRKAEDEMDEDPAAEADESETEEAPPKRQKAVPRPKRRVQFGANTKRKRSQSVPAGGRNSTKPVDVEKEAKIMAAKKASAKAAKDLAARTAKAKEASTKAFIRNALLVQFREKNRTHFINLCTKAGGMIAVTVLRKLLKEHRVGHKATDIEDTPAKQPKMIQLLVKLADKVSDVEGMCINIPHSNIQCFSKTHIR